MVISKRKIGINRLVTARYCEVSFHHVLKSNILSLKGRFDKHNIIKQVTLDKSSLLLKIHSQNTQTLQLNQIENYLQN